MRTGTLVLAVHAFVLENEILRRAAAYFARENVLPK